MRKPKSAPNGRTVIQDQWKKRPGIRAGLEDLVVSQFVRTFEGAFLEHRPVGVNNGYL